MDEGEPIAAMKLIREETGAGLLEAKATYEHLTMAAGHCHWCKASIPMVDYIDCPECRALNIDVRRTGDDVISRRFGGPMLADHTLRVADGWWARDFACSPQQLRPAATHVQEHAGELTGDDGIWILAVGTWPLVSLPPRLFPHLRERAQAWSRETLATSRALEEGLAPIRPTRIVGPAFIGYATRECLRTDVKKRARQLVETEGDAATALRTHCDAEAWEHGGSAFGHVPTFGAFDEDGGLAALAGYETWGQIAHISIVSAPHGRSQGYGTAAVLAAAEHALEAGLVPQYRTLKANGPSMRVAERLGFQEYGVSIYVKIDAAET
jgi:GNAT superfamily N-acetyltransferase